MGTEATNPQFTRHVDRVYADRLADLFAAGEHVESLVAHPGFPIVMGILEAESASINRSLDNGGVLEQAEYALKHGRRGGLNGFEEAAAAIVERASRRRTEQSQKHEGDAESSPER